MSAARDPRLIILAGGASSRMKKSAAGAADSELFREATEKPKGMIAVGGDRRPFLDYLLSNIADAGYADVAIVVGARDTSIRDYYERDGAAAQFPSLRISYAPQQIPPGREKPLGTADAVLAALDANPRWAGGSFTVCNGDNLYSVGSLRLLLHDGHRNAMIDYDRAGLRFSEERIAQFAVLQKDPDGYLLDIVEKPTTAEIASFADRDGRIGVSMNIFRFATDDILPCLRAVPLHPTRAEKELSAAVRLLARETPRSVFTIPLSEHVIDLTTQSDIPDVRRLLRDGFPRFA